jgi:ABC-type antimicrobial peptide transport system permease subunit
VPVLVPPERLNAKALFARPVMAFPAASSTTMLVLISATKLALAGCAIGLLGSIAASRLLGSLLFEVSAFDPLVLVLSAILVLLLALVACLLPARRASAVDPMQALRAE